LGKFPSLSDTNHIQQCRYKKWWHPGWGGNYKMVSPLVGSKQRMSLKWSLQNGVTPNWWRKLVSVTLIGYFWIKLVILFHFSEKNCISSKKRSS